ncbi:hypothetical protein ACDX66_00835 [Peribacillus frigoritolerans]
MNLEKLFETDEGIQKRFDYKNLYNDSRGSVFKDECKAILKEAVQKGIITVQKFIVAKDVQEELRDFLEKIDKSHKILVTRLKNYPMESDAIVTPFIYILKKMDPNYEAVITDKSKLEIKSNYVTQISPRIDEKNATPRLFFPNEKVAISSINDKVENLVEILAVRDVSVYIVGWDEKIKNIVAYKVIRSEPFFKVAENKDNIFGINL